MERRMLLGLGWRCHLSGCRVQPSAVRLRVRPVHSPNGRRPFELTATVQRLPARIPAEHAFGVLGCASAAGADTRTRHPSNRGTHPGHLDGIGTADTMDPASFCDPTHADLAAIGKTCTGSEGGAAACAATGLGVSSPRFGQLLAG